MSRYAVIDIETTGLSPAYHHRIVEIAVVVVDDEGNVVHEWETLINPRRDVGATEIHGLAAGDLHSAPTFEGVASEIVSLLQGRVPVAHNLAFDAPFVAAEFDRAGYPVPLRRTTGLCTMRLASRYLPTSGRTLESCCEDIGYQVGAAHVALEDARATARLLAYYIEHDDNFVRYWVDVITNAQDMVWPAVRATPTLRVTRKSLALGRRQHFLGRLVSRAPRSELHPGANSYLALLDRALLDRQISRHEEGELVSAAEMMGLSREDVLGLHRRYLSALGQLASKDGFVTSEELEDFHVVASLLGLTPEDVEISLKSDSDGPTRLFGVGDFALRRGDAIVFTGDAPGIERTDLEYQARTLGLRVTAAVSGKTSLVVAADPDSLSGKARKARDLGIPIVGYSTYFRMLDSMRGETTTEQTNHSPLVPLRRRSVWG